MDGPEDRVPCEDFATCGVAQFQNRQYWKNVKQQDSYFVVEDIGATFGVHLGHAQRVSLYGVADGHGEFGEISANFVRRNLPPQLAQSPHFAAGRLNDALLESFMQTELLQQSAGLPLWASGACVLAAAVSPTHIVVANCGDCRSVLADQGTAQDLSNDHNVEGATPEEIQRILNSGGTIMPDKRVTVPGAPGRLATTRSLGDYWAKPQGPPEKHIISGLPELRTIRRQPGQQYLVLASDGIFGFMSSQDVVTLCLSASAQVAPTAPLSRLAHTVLCTAVNARKSDDNCTCLVVDLMRIEAPTMQRYPELRPPESGMGGRHQMDLLDTPQTPPMPANSGLLRNGRDEPHKDALKDDSDVSLSSLVAPDEVCWCPWCWHQNRDGNPENVVLGSFERWRQHLHDQHFDKLGGAYGPDEVVPCYWCCRPCVTKKGQSRTSNRLPFWGSHERVCRENPNKPTLPSQTCSGGSSSLGSSDRRPQRGPDAGVGDRNSGFEMRRHDESSADHRPLASPPPSSHHQSRNRERQHPQQERSFSSRRSPVADSYSGDYDGDGLDFSRGYGGASRYGGRSVGASQAASPGGAAPPRRAL